MTQLPLPLIRAAVEQMLDELRADDRLSALDEPKGALALSLADAIDQADPVSRSNLSRELRLVLESLGKDTADRRRTFGEQARALGLPWVES
jgi:hypothetical protein